MGLGAWGLWVQGFVFLCKRLYGGLNGAFTVLLNGFSGRDRCSPNVYESYTYHHTPMLRTQAWLHYGP